jgi:hypothetical protein
MAFVLADRVQQTGSANTTVSFTLSGSVTGFQAFTVIGNNNTTYYAATDTSGSWEVGIGTYTLSTTTLARTTVIASSNSGSAVSTFSGTVTVFVTYPAGYSANAVGGGIGAINLNASEVTVNASISTGQNGFSVGPITIASGKSVTVASGQRWLVL